MRCARCGAEILPPAIACGCAAGGEAKPPGAPVPPPKPYEPRATWLPTRNKPALIGYYLAIAAVVPFVAFLAIPAMLLGAIGIGTADRVGQGKGHAVTAIVVGLASLVFWGGVWLGWWSVPIVHPFGC